MKKRIVSLILALMLILSLTACAKDGGEIAKDSRSGVVRVLVEGYDGYYMGSAFGVGEVGEDAEYFVTNFHVAFPEAFSDKYPDMLVAPLHVWLMKNSGGWDSANGAPDTSHLVKCDIEYFPDNGIPDIVILNPVETIPGRVALPLLSEDEEVEAGDSVYALGYPGASDAIEAEVYGGMKLVAGMEDVTITRGIVSRLTESIPLGNIDVIQHDARISHGNSGGPLINEKGAVVGVNTWGIEENAAGISIDIKYVREILEDEGIYFETYSGTNWLMIGIIAGIAALIIIVVVIIVVVSSKNKKKAVPAPVPAPPVPPVYDHQPPVAPVRDGRPRLQCKAGAFVGKRFSLENSVRIGRDPGKNDLVFPANTQGVSGVHCVLMVDGNTVWLKDLGSTYGTYIAGGRRLAANEAVQLQMGDQFWLGSEKELFVIAPQGGI